MSKFGLEVSRWLDFAPGKEMILVFWVNWGKVPAPLASWGGVFGVEAHVGFG